MKTIVSSLEVLEARIAPAALATLHISTDQHTATYTDVDGDHITLKVTHFAVGGGLLSAGLFSGVAGAHGDQLQLLDLSGGGFDKASLTFSVVRVAGGDGLANVGYINSTGHDLGAVTVKGDLGQLDAGDAATLNDPGVTALNVRSLGRLGLDTQGGGGSLESDIHGALGALTVAGDVKEAYVVLTGGADGKLGAVTIGGSLIGGAVDDQGRIFSSGDMGMVKIGRDVQGGAGLHSGRVESGGKLAGLSLGGSLFGGAGDESGLIYSIGDMGAVKIGHDIDGGSGNFTGRVEADGTLRSVTVGGSVIGSAAFRTAQIYSLGDMGLVKIGYDLQAGAGSVSGVVESFAKLAGVRIGGSLLGGATSGSGQVLSQGDLGAVNIGHDVLGGAGDYSGFIHGFANVASVTIGGSLVGGSGASSGAIYSFGDLGAVKIGHDLQGGAGVISGYINTTGKLAGVTIGGSLHGGTDTASGAIFSHGDLGAVKIGHDLTGSSITGATSLDSLGIIESTAGRIASVTLGGSIILGIDTSTGTLTNNATIRAANDLGSLSVAGGIIGNAGDGTAANGSPVIIAARGQAGPLPFGTTTDLAIGKITVGGRVEFANILAGYKTDLSAVNGDAQIGAVKVGGDWAASNLIAGAKNLGADDAAGGTGANTDNVNFGDTHDVSIGAGSAIVAKIASITIGGQVFGTPASFSPADHFGFVAQQIGAVKIGGNLISFTVTNAPQPIGETADMDLHLIS